MTDQTRIHALRDILLKLHHGAAPEEVQADFNHHFSEVSAVEIALMEQELMNEDTGITFEDVMKLCTVHARLFEDHIQDTDSASAEHPGHPIRLFRDENAALRATLLRIQRLLDSPEDLLNEPGVLRGLQRQLDLLGQFKIHYFRKENVFFPYLEAHGHTAPPKVMWGVDDEIRALFDHFQDAVTNLPEESLDRVQSTFQAFREEFEEMIFKEEAILLPMLLEVLTTEEWQAIAQESSQYGYAIIKPSAVWPEEKPADPETLSEESSGQDPSTSNHQVIDTPAGTLEVSWTPKVSAPSDRQTPLPFGTGQLTLEEVDLIFQHLPMELTFIDKDLIFQYFNDHLPFDQMIFPRTQGQVGRHVEFCHPPQLVDKVMALIDDLKSGRRDKEELWYQRDDQFIHITYQGIFNENQEFLGVLEYVQDIQAYRELQDDKRHISPLKDSHPSKD